MTKVGRLKLEAVVAVSDEHDVERYLEDLRKQFANQFSIAVHEYYPDASIHTEVKVGPLPRRRPAARADEAPAPS